MEKLDIPQGTLDLMILTLLAREFMHGYGISQGSPRSATIVSTSIRVPIDKPSQDRHDPMQERPTHESAGAPGIAPRSARRSPPRVSDVVSSKSRADSMSGRSR